MGNMIRFSAKRAKPWELHKPTATETRRFCERYRLFFPAMELLLVQGARVQISWPRDDNDREGLVITGVDPARGTDDANPARALERKMSRQDYRGRWLKPGRNPGSSYLGIDSS